MRDELESNKRRLEGEKAVLQDEARRLGVKVETVEAARNDLSLVAAKERREAAAQLKNIKDNVERQQLADKMVRIY